MPQRVVNMGLRYGEPRPTRTALHIHTPVWIGRFPHTWGSAILPRRLEVSNCLRLASPRLGCPVAPEVALSLASGLDHGPELQAVHVRLLLAEHVECVTQDGCAGALHRRRGLALVVACQGFG